MTDRLQMEDPSAAVQKSIYAALLAANIGAPIYDTPPPGETRAYIVIGESYSVPNNTKDIPGRRVFNTIHIWSTAPGFKEVKEITSKIENALTAGPLIPATGDAAKFYFLNIQHERSQHFTDTDGRNKHGTTEVVVEVQKK